MTRDLVLKLLRAAGVALPMLAYTTLIQAQGASFIASRTFALRPPATGIAVGDFNNDGRPDVVVAIAGYGFSVLLGNGDGSLQPANTTFASSVSTFAATGDFNADGKLDLVLTGQFDGILVLIGNGDGTFQTPRYLSTTSPTSVAVADLNGDGKLDLAVTNYVAGTVSIMFGKGDGTFQNPTTYTVGSGPFYAAIGDFNGDGKLDLAVANYGTNTVTIVLGNGDGTFTQATGSPIPVGNQPYAIAAGDFTGNGKLGLAVANFGDNNVSILLGNGDGSFTQGASAPTPVGKGPISLAVGDFNSSGRLGLAVTNITDGTVSILVQQ